MREYLDVFCIAYLENILIYSIKKENYANHMLQVLRQLHKQGLQININKCKFSTIKIKYLDIIITTNGIEIDTEKMETIQH